jgi:phosphatidylglycerophosphate synthase
VIREAVLYLASLDDLATARLPVACRPLAFRIVMAAVRAGVTRVSVPEALRDPALEACIARTPSARAAVRWITATAAPPIDDVLFLPAGMLVTAATLKPLVATKRTQMLDGLPHDAPVAATASYVAAGLWRDAADGRPVGADLAHALAVTGAKRIPAAGVTARIDGGPRVLDVETRLYQALGSPIDSPLDRVFHRRLSRGLTRWAVAHGVAPNTITIGGILIGLAGALALASDGVRGALTGLGLYVVAVVLDHADGEVARVSFTESRFGEWLDVGGDTLVHATLVLAMGLTCERATGAGAVWGVVAAAGVLASAWAMKTSPPAANRIAGVFEALGNRDGFYAMLVAFVLGLAFWPAALPALMVAVAVGTHAYWLGSALARRRRAV